MCSCSTVSNEDNFDLEKENARFNSLYISIEKLNGKFSPEIQKATSRGGNGELVPPENPDDTHPERIIADAAYSIAKRGADAIGASVGGWAGKHIGATLGAMGGNPVTAIGGWVIGRWAGRTVGSALASAVIHQRFLEDTVNNHDGDPIVPIDSVADRGKQLEIGNVHNILLYKLTANKSRYLGTFNIINYDSLYSCVLEYADELEFELDSAFYSSYAKQEFVNAIQCIENSMSNYVYGNSSIEETSSNIFNTLGTRYNIDESEINGVSGISSLILSECEYLESDEIEEYANSVSSLISNSEIGNEAKEELIGEIEVLKSSNIFWTKIQ